MATGDVPDAPRKATSQADAMADQDLRDHQQDDADDVERVRDLWPALVATWQGRGQVGVPPRPSRWCRRTARADLKRCRNTTRPGQGPHDSAQDPAEGGGMTFASLRVMYGAGGRLVPGSGYFPAIFGLAPREGPRALIVRTAHLDPIIHDAAEQTLAVHHISSGHVARCARRAVPSL